MIILTFSNIQKMSANYMSGSATKGLSVEKENFLIEHEK